jgi:murein DD-endopeptidase MepM/ murein hydrolase activator NlpD
VAPVQPVRTEQVARRSLDPVSTAHSRAPDMSRPALAPVAVEPARQTPGRIAAVDRSATGTGPLEPRRTQEPRQPFPLSAEDDPKGWSRAGGTQITVKPGESVYNLARRFGVPAHTIMETNGLASADKLQAGQKIVIPTYVYSDKAKVSAPDSDPRTREARSSTGTRWDVPADKVPLPTRAPSERIAVVPERPRQHEPEIASQQRETPLRPGSAGETPEPKLKAGASGAYTVQQGDTLAAIARNRGISTAALMQANGLSDGRLRIGQQLTIPAAGATAMAEAKPAPVPAMPVQVAAIPAKKDAAKTDAVKTGSVSPDAGKVSTYTPPKQAEAVMDEAAKVAAVAPDSTGIDRMRWPVRGRVIVGFGKDIGGKPNDGIDIAVPEGTPIKAAENGVVIYAGNGLEDFGNTVLVRHEDGVVTVYGHADTIKVSRGDKVKRGEDIATAGNTGNADTPKLHFEVRKNSAPVDPSGYLE